VRVAIIGGGWAGLAAAVAAAQAGQQVTVYEAARSLGGRARGVAVDAPGAPGTPDLPSLPGAPALRLDNGQHILIGAYTDTLRLLRLVGVNPEAALLRLPLALRFPDGSGLALPDLPAPWDALLGIARTRGWSLIDKLCLLRTAAAWQWRGFVCAPGTSVAQLCVGLTQRLKDEFIEPLCISALNTPAAAACGTVFLRVLQDAMFGPRGGSNLLLPRVDLGALWPEAAAHWLAERGHRVLTGQRVQHLHPARTGSGWQLDLAPAKLPAPAQPPVFDRVILATAPSDAARLVRQTATTLPQPQANALHAWANCANALRYEAITTVYAQASAPLPPGTPPMQALRASAAHPAQFVFDRGQLGGPPGLLAFVISASQGQRHALQTQVIAQAQVQLGWHVSPVQTITEKRATFACTPGLQRPGPQLAPGLLACGDYIAGPYPATLEGAARSGWAAGSVAG
jgi:squalene-associated FAD-dependent desaturase